MPHIDVDGCSIHYRLEGESDRPILMLSNSLGTRLEMWEPQMERLLGRFRVLRYDSRGHGRSEVTEGPYDIERLGRDALALLDHLGVDRVAWCGLSLGGMVGMWLGAHAGNRLTRAILANTAAHMGPAGMWDQRIATVRSQGMDAIADAVVARWFTPSFIAARPDAVAPLREMLATTPPEGYAACCAAVRGMDQRRTVPSITTPVLVIVGDQDQATPPAAGEWIAANVPGARVGRLDAAHLSNVEQPEAFTRAVLDFLT